MNRIIGAIQSINFFSNRIVAIYNDEDSPTEEPQPDLDTEES